MSDDGSINISSLVKVLSETSIEYDDYEFELKKKGKRNNQDGKVYDIFFCVGKSSHKCRIIIRRDCSTSSFIISRIHSEWEHKHISKARKERLEAQSEKWEEDRKKTNESENILEKNEYKQHYNRNQRLKTLPLSDLENLPDEVIILISSNYLPPKDMANFRCSSRCFDQILNKNEFFCEFAKNQFGFDVLEENDRTNWKQSPRDVFRTFLTRTIKEYRNTIVRITNGPKSLYDISIPKEMRCNLSFAFEAVRIDSSFLQAFQELKNNPQLKIRAKRTKKVSISDNRNLRKNKEAIHQSILHFGDTIRFCEIPLTSKYFWRDIRMEAARNYGCSIRNISNDEEIPKKLALVAVKQDGRALKFVRGYKDDETIVLEAVKNYGFALEFASERLKNNKKIVQQSILWSGESIFYASEHLKNDYNMAIFAIKNFNQQKKIVVSEEEEMINYSIFSFRNIFRRAKILENKRFVIDVMRINGLYLKFLSFDFRSDKEIVLEAILQNKDSFIFANENLKSDFDVRKAAGVQQ